MKIAVSMAPPGAATPAGTLTYEAPIVTYHVDGDGELYITYSNGQPTRYDNTHRAATIARGAWVAVTVTEQPQTPQLRKTWASRQEQEEQRA